MTNTPSVKQGCFSNPYLDGWSYETAPRENNTLLVLENRSKDLKVFITDDPLEDRVNSYALELLDTDKIKRVPLYNTDLGFNCFTKKSKLKTSTIDKVNQALYEHLYPDQKLEICTLTALIRGKLAQIIRVSKLESSSLFKFKLFHPNWVFQYMEKDAYFVPKKYTYRKEGELLQYIARDLKYDFKPAKFITTNETSHLYSLNDSERKFLGRGVDCSVYSYADFTKTERLALKYGKVSYEKDILRELWNRIDASQEKVRGIIKPIATTLGEDQPIILKAYKGDLDTFAFKEELAFEIIEGLYWLAHFEVIHVDIKLPNILVKEGEAVIADFGNSYIFPKGEFTKDDKDDLMHFLDNIIIMTPEYGDELLWETLHCNNINGNNLSPNEFKKHIISLAFLLQVTEVGISLFQWITHYNPYEYKNFVDKVKQGFAEGYKTSNFEKFIDDENHHVSMRTLLLSKCSEKLTNLLLRMIDPDPFKRLTFLELKTFLNK